jgi:hypothetical protein
VAGAIVGQTGGQNMRKRYRKILVAAALTALASMAILASAAEAATPAPPYQGFAGCPSPSENENVAFCVRDEFSGGHIKLGSLNIPVSHPFALRGGSEYFTGDFLGNSEAGITPVAQPVTGGLLGMATGNELIEGLISKHSSLQLNASVELAGTPGSFHGSSLSLPIKVHLENPLVGNSCYIGSDAAPVQLNLAITKEGSEFEEVPSLPEVLVSSGGVYGDSTYAVPGANGCAVTIGSHKISINSLVNAAYHLPATAGASSTVLDYSYSIVSPEVVYP